MTLTRKEIEEIQLTQYNDPHDNRAYGEGPMQEACIRLRRQIARQLVEKIIGRQDPNLFSFLDIGCGQGDVCDDLTKLGVHSFGIDIAGRRIADTKTKYPLARYVLGRGQELPIAPSSMHGITAFEIFEHMDAEDGEQMLRACFRILVPGGIIALSTINKSSLAGRVRSLLQIPTREDHINEVSCLDLRNSVQRAGFENIKVGGIGLLPGMWQVQNAIPCTLVHDINPRLGNLFPPIASETLIIAQKPQSDTSKVNCY